MKVKVMATMLLLLLTVGCATKVNLSVNGQPMPDKVMRVALTQHGIKLDLSFVRYYGEKEGDEILNTMEFLALNTKKPNEISPSHLQDLVYSAQIYNPRKAEYRLWVEQSIGEGKRVYHVPIYSGNLSHKVVSFALPVAPGNRGWARFVMYDAEDFIIFESPKASFEIASNKKRGPQNYGLNTK